MFSCMYYNTVSSFQWDHMVLKGFHFFFSPLSSIQLTLYIQIFFYSSCDAGATPTHLWKSVNQSLWAIWDEFLSFNVVALKRSSDRQYEAVQSERCKFQTVQHFNKNEHFTRNTVELCHLGSTCKWYFNIKQKEKKGKKKQKTKNKVTFVQVWPVKCLVHRSSITALCFSELLQCFFVWVFFFVLKLFVKWMRCFFLVYIYKKKQQKKTVKMYFLNRNMSFCVPVMNVCLNVNIFPHLTNVKKERKKKKKERHFFLPKKANFGRDVGSNSPRLYIESISLIAVLYKRMCVSVLLLLPSSLFSD